MCYVNRCLQGLFLEISAAADMCFQSVLHITANGVDLSQALYTTMFCNICSCKHGMGCHLMGLHTKHDANRELLVLYLNKECIYHLSMTGQKLVCFLQVCRRKSMMELSFMDLWNPFLKGSKWVAVIPSCGEFHQPNNMLWKWILLSIQDLPAIQFPIRLGTSAVRSVIGLREEFWMMFQHFERRQNLSSPSLPCTQRGNSRVVRTRSWVHIQIQYCIYQEKHTQSQHSVYLYQCNLQWSNYDSF